MWVAGRAALKKGGLGKGKAGEGGGEPAWGHVSCVVFAGYIVSVAPPGAPCFTFYKELSIQLFGWITTNPGRFQDWIDKVPGLEPSNNSVRSALFFLKEKIPGLKGGDD